MTRISVNPGKVEWSGENPGIYLKETPDGDYTTLALFFRIVLSPYGRGHAGLILGAPDTAKGWPNVTNFLITDNQRLMRWIVENWVVHMPTFHNRIGLEAMRWLHLVSCSRTPGDMQSQYSEVLRGHDMLVRMCWKDLGKPFPVEANVANSATGKHEMYAVFLEAANAKIYVNDTLLPGHVATRELFGRTMSTAFLALSETWITPDSGD